MGALVPFVLVWLNGSLVVGWGVRPAPTEETTPFIPALLPDRGTQKNKTALSCSSTPALGHPETVQNKQRYSSQVNYRHQNLLWSPGPSCCEWGATKTTKHS